MRKVSLVLLSIGALLALSLYWQGPASAEGTKLAPPEGFGKKIAGPGMTLSCIIRRRAIRGQGRAYSALAQMGRLRLPALAPWATRPEAGHGKKLESEN